MTVPWAKRLPERRVFDRVEVWLVDEGDVWQIRCMECGTRLGTVNAGNERGAVRLTEDHQQIIHR